MANTEATDVGPIRAIRMDKLSGAGRLCASWLDPRTGAQTPIGTFPNTGVQAFSTPSGWEDAILLLEAAVGSI